MAEVPSVPGVPLYRGTVRDGTASKMVVPCVCTLHTIAMGDRQR